MRRSGYETRYLGKWHLAAERHIPNQESFIDRGVPPELRDGYDDYWLASDTLEFTSHGHDGHMFDADGIRRDFSPGAFALMRKPIGCWNIWKAGPVKSHSSCSIHGSNRITKMIIVATRVRTTA